jgi:hypothetical protein
MVLLEQENWRRKRGLTHFIPSFRVSDRDNIMKRTLLTLLVALCIIVAGAIQTALNKRARVNRERAEHAEQVEISVPVAESSHSS